jgi:nucleoside-diphosphate-sugar epimerase
MEHKKILVCGAGGFIGTHLVNSLKLKGHYVVGVDLKRPDFNPTTADEFYVYDLRDRTLVNAVISKHRYDEIYQLAADMGGAGFISTGLNDADIMHNSVTINLNVLDAIVQYKQPKVFYSSSACVYPEHNQEDPDNPLCSEESAYPADPDSEYGWEKLFSERLYLTYSRNYGIDIRIARLHNIYGPFGSWNDGREKAPAALCRKVAQAKDGDSIEVWGPGTQTRSFLFIDECIEGIHRLMASDCKEPLNLGSTRMISINNLVKLIAGIANKSITLNNVNGPRGVMGRNSDNNLIKEKLNWAPNEDLEYGIEITYNWIKDKTNDLQ